MMRRLLSTLVLGFGLLVMPVDTASAGSADSFRGGSGQYGRGHRSTRHRHRPRRHHHRRGKRIKSVPELDAGSAAAALILLLGGAVVINERRRLRPVLRPTA